MRRPDVVVAVVALSACAAAFTLTYFFTVNAAAAMLGGMGAEYFPRLIIGVIAVLAVCILFGVGNPPMEVPAPVPGMVWVAVAILAAYVAVVELAGMWLASFVLMVGLGRIWGVRDYAKLSLMAAGLLGVIWLVFVRILKGNFPEGLVARLWS